MIESCPSCGSRHEPQCCIHCRQEPSTNGTKSCDNCRRRKTTPAQIANDIARFKRSRASHIGVNQNTHQLESMYSPKEVAKALGCHFRTVQTHLRTGRLKGFKMGSSRQALWRIPKSSLEEFIQVNNRSLEKVLKNLGPFEPSE